MTIKIERFNRAARFARLVTFWKRSDKMFTAVEFQ